METALAWRSNKVRGGIVVSISACHAEDPGSIPGRGVLAHILRNLLFQRMVSKLILSSDSKDWFSHERCAISMLQSYRGQGLSEALGAGYFVDQQKC